MPAITSIISSTPTMASPPYYVIHHRKNKHTKDIDFYWTIQPFYNTIHYIPPHLLYWFKLNTVVAFKRLSMIMLPSQYDLWYPFRKCFASYCALADMLAFITKAIVK